MGVADLWGWIVRLLAIRNKINSRLGFAKLIWQISIWILRKRPQDIRCLCQFGWRRTSNRDANPNQTKKETDCHSASLKMESLK